MKPQITKKVVYEYNCSIYETENDAKQAAYRQYTQNIDNKLTECAENILTYNNIDGVTNLLKALIGTLSQKEISTIRQTYNKAE